MYYKAFLFSFLILLAVIIFPVVAIKNLKHVSKF